MLVPPSWRDRSYRDRYPEFLPQIVPCQAHVIDPSVGSSGVGKVLSSTAAECAIQILNQTSDGVREESRMGSRETLSSAKQRSGRCGRVCAGVCIKLFSKEEEEKMEARPLPKIHTGNLLKLMDPIPSDTLKAAIDDAENIMREGRVMLDIGMHIELFLTACSNMDCLSQGVDISSVLLTDSPTNLLPHKEEKTSLKDLIHPSGDHLTLMNVFRRFQTKKNKMQCHVNDATVGRHLILKSSKHGRGPADGDTKG
ncbi:hypothetical protein PROFUN_09139 [Planoprotostelium fungivorum]|uniref:Uncharacterized protein n=1 Tax=Planoprotostelium fungivorum TaxID=1890364 RepID=A0A2P6MVI6_9EUKA|nr:hypothetical protein PROFUN_09139 [Planoprotostelium fungivorum]